MRLRTAGAASAAALFLGLTLTATSASAASGSFHYTYVDSLGDARRTALENPPSDECLNLPEAMGAGTPAAYSPMNRTHSTVTAFTEPDCEGDWLLLGPDTGGVGKHLVVRSLILS